MRRATSVCAQLLQRPARLSRKGSMRRASNVARIMRFRSPIQCAWLMNAQEFTATAAFPAFSVSRRYDCAVTRAAAASPLLAEHLASPAAQAEVVRMSGTLDAPALGKVLSRRAAELDPAWRQRSHDEQRAARFLQISHTPSGTLLKGRLDSVAGNLVQRAVDALNPRPAADDDRAHQRVRAHPTAAALGQRERLSQELKVG